MDGKPLATLRSTSGVPTGRLAIWWLLGSEIVIFGGVLMSYLMHRIGHVEFGDPWQIRNQFIALPRV